MQHPKPLALLLVLSFALTHASLADDDDDDDDDRDERSAPMVKFEDNKERYRYEYRDRRCRYKYEYSYRSGKTKVDQKGDCRGIAMARPVAQGEPQPRAIPPDPGARRLACNREVIGAIIGGAIGGHVGSRVGEGRERAIITVGGAIIGAVVGGAIGRSMDQADQACVAQALEYANLNQSVAWRNAAGGTSYVVTPIESLRSATGAECRRYVLRTVSGAGQHEQTGRACRRSDGAWVPQG